MGIKIPVNGSTIFYDINQEYKFEVDPSWEVSQGIHTLRWTFTLINGNVLQYSTTGVSYLNLNKDLFSAQLADRIPIQLVVDEMFSGVEQDTWTASFYLAKNQSNMQIASITSPSSSSIMPDSSGNYVFSVQSSSEITSGKITLTWKITDQPSFYFPAIFERTISGTNLMTVPTSSVPSFTTVYTLYVKSVDTASGNEIGYDEVQFSFGKKAPDKPIVISPSTNAEVGQRVTVASEPYYGWSTSPTSMRIIITGPFWTGYDSGNIPYSTEHVIPQLLPTNKPLSVVLTHTSDFGETASSDPVVFYTIKSQPSKPRLITPINLSNLNSEIPLSFSSSDYEGMLDSLLYISEWKFSKTSDPKTDPNASSYIFTHNYAGSPRPSVSIPISFFNGGLRYTFVFRYIDYAGRNSEWSDVYSMTTRKNVPPAPILLRVVDQRSDGVITTSIMPDYASYSGNIDYSAVFVTNIQNDLNSASETDFFGSPYDFEFTIEPGHNPYVYVAFFNEHGRGDILDITSNIIWYVPIQKPTLMYPVTYIPAEYLNLQLQGNIFSGPGVMNSAVWQISRDPNFSTLDWGGTGYTLIGDISLGRNQSGSASQLLILTDYYARTKYCTNYGGGRWSDWSDAVKFTTRDILEPLAPTILTADGTSFPTSNVSLQPLFVSSTYSPRGTEAGEHKFTDWEVTFGTTSTVDEYSYKDATNLESWTPSEYLKSASNLRIRSRYWNKSGAGAWSNWAEFITLYAAPSKPGILSPPQSGTGVNVLVSLIGSQYVGDYPHEESIWQISASANFTSPVFVSTTTVNLESITVGSGVLSYFTKYYARVKYKNDAQDWSDWSDEAGSYSREFLTQVNIPTKPTCTSPSNNGTSISQNLTLISSSYSGDSISTHSQSRFQVSFGSSFDSMVYDQITGPSITTVVSSGSCFAADSLEDSDKLDAWTDHYWRVAYKNETGWSSWSNPFTFKTLPTVPKAPINTYPSDGTRQISLLPTFITSKFIGRTTHLSTSWELRSYGTSSYGTSSQLVWFSPSNGSCLTSISVSSGTFLTSGTSLDNGVWYEWRSQFNNFVGSSSWSDETKFLSVVLSPPNTTIILTSGLSEDVPVSGNQFISGTWQGGGYGEHFASNWQIGTNASFGTSQITEEYISYSRENLESWTHSLDLQRFSTYYTRVRHGNETGWSSWSSPVTFRTVVSPPEKPVNIFPISGATGINWMGESSFQSSNFNPVETPQFRSHLYSYWQFSSDPNFTDVYYVGTTTGTGIALASFLLGSCVLSGLSSKWVYWREAHSNIGGISEWSDAWIMKLLPKRPEKPSMINPINGSETFQRSNDAVKSSPYIGEGTHLKTQFQILDGTTETIIWQTKTLYEPLFLVSNIVNSSIGNFLNTHAGRSTLRFNAQYGFKVKYQNENEHEWSEWSDSILAKTALDVPNRPILISPTDGSETQSIHPELVTEEYVGMGSHIATNWQISSTSTFSSTDIVWEAVEINTTNTSEMEYTVVNNVNGAFKNILVGEDSLEYNLTYYWRARFKNDTGWSNWSETSYFITKASADSITKVPEIYKKLDYLVDRMVKPHVGNRYPKFKEFIRWWLKFVSEQSSQFIFYLSDFKTISDFYSRVETFDWAQEIKDAHFRDYISDTSLDVLANVVYEGREVDPEILRFIRSLNVRKGSPISFQVALKALGYEVTVNTTGPFEYNVVNTDGKIRTADDFKKLNKVIELFHPAGMDYTTSAELMSPISTMSHKTLKDIISALNVTAIPAFLSTVYNSSTLSGYLAALKIMFSWRYEDEDDYKVETKVDFGSSSLLLNSAFGTGLSFWTVIAKNATVTFASGTSGTVRITQGSSAEYVSLCTQFPIKWGRLYEYAVIAGTGNTYSDFFTEGTTSAIFGVSTTLPSSTSAVAVLDIAQTTYDSLGDFTGDMTGSFNTCGTAWLFEFNPYFIFQVYTKPFKYIELTSAHIVEVEPSEAVTGYGPFDIQTTPIINFSFGMGSASLYHEKFSRSVQRPACLFNE